MEDRDAKICDAAADQCTATRSDWHADSSTDRHVACNNYLDQNMVTKCQIVSLCVVIAGPNLRPTLLRVHEMVLMEDEAQKESLLHPYQEMAHHCQFNLTPMGCSDANKLTGEPKMIVEDVEIPFLFDGRKVCQHIRKLMAEELRTFPEVDVTAPTPHNPSSTTHLQPVRRNTKKTRS